MAFNIKLYILLSVIYLLLTNPVSAAVTVNITGVENSLKEQILASLSLERQKNHERLTDNRIRTLFKYATDEIKLILEANGYYKSSISPQLDYVNDTWIATFNIDTGEPLIIREINIAVLGDAKNDHEFMQTVDSFPFKTGDTLNHAKYESWKKLINNLAYKTGYFDGVWDKHDINISLEKNSAVINIIYDSKIRYVFGDINISENILSDSIVKQYLNINSGDPYNSDLLLELQRKLRDSGYFRNVDVTPSITAAENKQIPVSVNLELRPENSYSFGIGYGTDTGPRLSAGWDNRYFNNKGHRIKTDLKIAPVLSSLSGAYLIPFFREKNAELGILSSLSREDTDTSLSKTYRAGVQHTASRWGWNETIGLTYQFEDFKIGPESNSSHLLIPSIGYNKAEFDSPVYTNEGFRLGIEFKASAEGLVSDVTFLQTHINGKYITSIGEHSRILVRGELGATAVTDFDALPASMRFFAGGDNSIRGFDFKSLGPKDDSGEIVGGRYLLAGSLEYEYRILEKWSVAGFTDFGNAFDNSPENLEYSVGAGIRWQSPIGLIRLDLAAGISADDTPLRLHVTIGPDL